MRTPSVFIVLLTCLAAVPAGVLGQGSSPPSSATCGNKLLEPGETCAACPADCTVQACRPGKSHAVFGVDFTPPDAPDVSTVVLWVGYRSDRLSLPGTGMEKSVHSRIKSPPGGSMLVTNDQDYALRAVASGTKAIPAGRLFTIEFDRCEGAPAPTVADLSCAVDACASSSGPAQGCHCTITAAAR
jgi:hypothetical protein